MREAFESEMSEQMEQEDTITKLTKEKEDLVRQLIESESRANQFQAAWRRARDAEAQTAEEKLAVEREMELLQRELAEKETQRNARVVEISTLHGQLNEEKTQRIRAEQKAETLSHQINMERKIRGQVDDRLGKERKLRKEAEGKSNASTLETNNKLHKAKELFVYCKELLEAQFKYSPGRMRDSVLKALNEDFGELKGEE
ncbi:hypothetical protein K505DRAFT_322282 [Melanomma pulvis-pyrius CBS 109.77]|uniref:Uncharacterized protein n=1 Tax=Melanomma pulvis-pyrius CBS 109.77 TaxID=1314802 RepID=A0A6A6XNB9_9PLEO|nr:hypothetical protein K505DRAFT_322282 [Melanomma pulvis-pyrius CBS 109.77]